MDSWLEIIASGLTILASFAGFVFFLGRHLISYWKKKGDELETTKYQNNKDAINRLDKQVTRFQSAVTSLEKKIQEMNSMLLQQQSDVKLVSERYKDLVKFIDNYHRDVDSKIKNSIKSEVHELTKQLIMIKNKKV